MPSVVKPDPEIPAEEELVAYLDGELPPDDCRRVEERLAADPAYRQRLHDLDRAWEALDALPNTQARDDFARTTIEFVTVAAHRDASEHSARGASAGRRRMWRMAAIGIVAVVVGFFVARLLFSLRDEAILNDLAVIRNVDLLSQIEDVDFLRRIHAVVLTRELLDDDTTLNTELANLAWTGAERRKARWKWVDGLSAEEKATLAGQARRFHELPAAERRRIRALYEQIEQAEDAAELRETFVAYGHWLGQLSPGEQEQLRKELSELPAEAQAEHVRRWLSRADQRRPHELSNEDAERLRAVVLAIVEERREQLTREMRRRGAADRAVRLEGPRGALMILNRELQNDDADSNARQRILEELSSEAKAHLERLGRRNRQFARYQLWHWIRDALHPKWGAGELEKFFTDDLDNTQRERLLNLPSGEMQAELERLYLANEYGLRGDREPGAGPRMDGRPGRPEFPRGFERHDRPEGPPPRSRPPSDDGAAPLRFDAPR